MSKQSNPKDGKAELDQAWTVAYEQAEKKFGELTKKYLKDFKDKDGKTLLRRDMKVDTLVTQVNGGRELAAAKRADHQNWTRVLKKVVVPIETLGGLAAGIAAVAFPGSPSGLAFNALSYLINTGHEVSASYDTLADLFEQITQFISRFEVLAKQEISPELMGIIHQVLISLIMICALSVRLLKHKLGIQWISAFFLGRDEKIQEQLTTLEKLSKYEEAMVVHLTLERVIGISRSIEGLYLDLPEIKEDIKGIKGHVETTKEGVQELLSNDKNREQSAKYQAQLKKMKDLIDPKTSDASREVYIAFSRELVSETGRWLRNEGLFKAWLNQEIPILAIHGDSGTGKSYLGTNVIQYLSDQYPQGVQHTSRVSVAYHFCRNYNRDLRMLKQGLRAIAYNIAQNDPVFANFFEGECKSKEELSTAQQVWDKLFMGFFCEKDVENRVYIVIDGLDQAFPSEREYFLKLLKDYEASKDRGRKIRVQILLIERESVEQPLKDVLGVEVPVIKITPAKNDDDIRRYVTRVVDENRRWHSVRGLREEIIESITKNAQGTFYLADYKLKDIRDKRRADDIRQALAENPKNLPDAIRSDLQRVGETLEKWEVEDLNELLAWVIVGKESFTLAQLEVINRLKNDEAGGGLTTLETQLRTRYGPLFNVTREDGRTTEDLQALQQQAQSEKTDGEAPEASQYEAYTSYISQMTGDDINFVDFRSDPQSTYVELANTAIRDYFQNQNEHKVSESVNKVEEAEVRIILRFLNLVCDKDLLNNLGINEFLQQKLQQKPALIDVNMNDAKLKVLDGCLTMILDEDLWDRYEVSHTSVSILDYCWKWIADHIENIDLAVLSVDDRERVGRKLMKLFRDEEVIRRWARDNNYISIDYLSSDIRTKHVLQWLGDKSVTDKFPEDDTRWIKELSTNAETHLLRPTIDVIAKEWLQNTKWSANTSYYTIRSYLTQIESQKKDFQYPEIEGYEKGSRASDILQIAKWTGFEENARWHERVGSTFLSIWETDLAMKYYRSAIELDAEDWRSHVGLAKSYANQDKWELAIGSMDKAISEIGNGSGDTTTRKEDEDFTFLLGQWHENLGHSGKALELFRKAHDSSFEATQPLFRILTILSRQENYGEIIELLQDMEHAWGSRNLTREVESYFEYHETDEFHQMIWVAARKTGSLEFIQKGYIRAIRAAEAQSKTIISGILRHWYGRLMQHEFGKRDEAMVAFEDVMKMSGSSSNDSSLGWARFQAAKRLAMIYIDRARTAGPGTPDAKINIQRLAQLSVGKTSYDDEAMMTLMTNTCSTINITLVLGRWYAQDEKNDKEAREHFKSHIKLGIDLLSDENPYNDTDAYKKLAYAFMHYGDDDNSLAAWSLLGPLEQDPSEPSTATSSEASSEASDDDDEKLDADEKALVTAVEEEQSGLTIVEKTMTENAESGEVDVVETTTVITIKESVMPVEGVETPPQDHATKSVSKDETTEPEATPDPIRETAQTDAKINGDSEQRITSNGTSGEHAEKADDQPAQPPLIEESPQEDGLAIEEPHNSTDSPETNGNVSVPEDSPPNDTDEADRDTPPSEPDNATEPEEPPRDPNDFSADTGYINLVCDGACGREWRLASDLNLCKICLDTGFCSECLVKMKHNELGFKVCNPLHDWLYIPKATERLPRGMVRLGAKDGGERVLMGIEEWKGRIREGWGLE